MYTGNFVGVNEADIRKQRRSCIVMEVFSRI